MSIRRYLTEIRTRSHSERRRFVAIATTASFVLVVVCWGGIGVVSRARQEATPTPVQIAQPSFLPTPDSTTPFPTVDPRLLFPASDPPLLRQTPTPSAGPLFVSPPAPSSVESPEL